MLPARHDDDDDDDDEVIFIRKDWLFGHFLQNLAYELFLEKYETL